MMENKHIQQIESYLRNEMDAEERKEFELKLADNEELRNEVEEARLIEKGIRYAARNDLRQMVENAGNAYRKKEVHGKMISRWRIGFITLIIAGLILLGYWFLWKGSRSVESGKEREFEFYENTNKDRALNSDPVKNDSLTSPEVTKENKRDNKSKDLSDLDETEGLLALAADELDNSFTDDFMPSSMTRQSGNSKDSILFLASEAFDNRNWREAIESFEKVNDLSDRSSAYIKLGIAYLQHNQFEKAINVFSTLKEKSPIPEWRQKAQWYLLLTYLSGGDQYLKKFEAELKIVLEDPTMVGKMKDRFNVLNSRYNSLCLFPAIMNGTIFKVGSIFDDPIYDFVKNSKYSFESEDFKIDFYNLPMDTSEIWALINEALQFNKERKYKEALDKAQAATELAKASSLEMSLINAEAISQCGNAQYGLLDFNNALRSFKEVFSIRNQLLGEENIEVAKICNNIAITFRGLNLLDSAIVYYLNQLHIYKEIYGEENANVAIIHSNIGETYIYKMDFIRSISYYSQALEFYEKDPVANRDMLGKIYNNLVYVYQSAGDFNKSIGVGKLSLQIWASIKGANSPEAGLVYMNMGNTYRDKGDYINATENLKKALQIFIDTLGDSHQYIGRAYNGLGLVFERTGDIDKALNYYQKTLLIILKNYDPNDPAVAAVYQNLAITYRKLDNFEKSIECFEKAIEINTNKYGVNSRAVSNNYSGLGNTYGMFGKLEDAESWHLKSLKIKEILGDTNTLSVASDYHNLGKLYYTHRNLKESIKCLQKSLDIKISLGISPSPIIANTYTTQALAYAKMNLFIEGKEAIDNSMSELNYNGITSLNGVNSKPQLLEALNVKGQLYYDWYKYSKAESDLEIAFQSFSDAIAVIDFQRKYFDNPNSKNSLARESVEIFEGAIRTGYLKNNFQQAFDFAEKSKSMALFELIRQSEALHFGEIPDSLLQLEYALRIEMISKFNKRQDLLVKKTAESDSVLLEVNSDLFDATRKFEALTEEFEQEYPKYANIRFNLRTTSIFKLKEQILSPNQTLIEYFAGDSSLFIFVVNKEDFQVIEVKRDFPLKEWVQQMREGIDVVGQKDPLDIDRIQGPQKYATAAHLLHQKLIEPVEAFLTENVIIIPDAELGWLPFEALLSEAPINSANFGSYKYLVRNHTISYAPSATVLMEMLEDNSHRKIPDHAWLGLAPFSEQPSYPVLDSLLAEKDIASRSGVERLPHSGEEIAIISKMTNGYAVYDTVASSEFFKQNAGKYRILHLSQHAKAERNIGDYSYLLFPDTLIYVRDIYNLQLNSDMVVLSACETGFGELRRGEGIIGMTRAFTYAGAKSLFTTLWSVNDQATRDLTVSFYNYMLSKDKKLPKAQALREAKLDLINRGETYAHPYYWAGMIGIGDMRALDLEGR